MCVCELYPEWLEKELHDYLPSSICNGIRVIPPPCGVDTAWHGAKLISNVIKHLPRSLVHHKKAVASQVKTNVVNLLVFFTSPPFAKTVLFEELLSTSS
ncbi:hypothetical protein YC2023_118306 [Brassica napus]